MKRTLLWTSPFHSFLELIEEFFSLIGQFLEKFLQLYFFSAATVSLPSEEALSSSVAIGIDTVTLSLFPMLQGKQWIFQQPLFFFLSFMNCDLRL